MERIESKGVGQDVVDCIDNLHIKQSPTGVAVGIDSTEGPLTDIEYETIQAALNNAYSQVKLMYPTCFYAISL